MRHFAVLISALALSQNAIRAESISTELSCAYPVDHQPSADVAAGDLNGTPRLPPIELAIRRYLPSGSGWFIDATLAVITLDPMTGQVTGLGGASLSTQSTDPRCE